MKFNYSEDNGVITCTVVFGGALYHATPIHFATIKVNDAFTHDQANRYTVEFTGEGSVESFSRVAGYKEYCELKAYDVLALWAGHQ